MREAEDSHAHQHEPQLSATLNDRKKSDACESQQGAAKRYGRVRLIGRKREHPRSQASEPERYGFPVARGLDEVLSVLLVEAKKAFLCVA